MLQPISCLQTPYVLKCTMYTFILVICIFAQKRTIDKLFIIAIFYTVVCRTCQLVLGAGAVSLAGLKTITIRYHRKTNCEM